eukprot:g21429.t1
MAENRKPDSDTRSETDLDEDGHAEKPPSSETDHSDFNPYSGTITGAEFSSRPPEDNEVEATGSLPLDRFGDYQLIREIARGGMGVVYHARQVSLNRDVALKMILSSRLASADDVRRFRAEAESAALLDHPHIVPIYEVGEHDGQHYFSMKLIDHGTLSDRIADFTADPRGAAEMMAEIAHAVHTAHQRGVLHRDLKPGNILLDADGSPHVADFGLAKRTGGNSELTATGQVMGTPNYMAPEQARGKTNELTTAADTYALGAILYELLTGRPPFQSESVVDTLRKVVDEPPPLPRTVNSSVDRDLETITLKCLEKSPERRYKTAEAFADDLELWLRGEPIHARPVSGWERAAKWVRRRPAIAAMSAGIVLTVLTALVVVTWQWRDAVDAREDAIAANDKKDNALRQLQSERDKAESAREETLDVLARSLFDQARAVRLARGSGHHWQALDLLERAHAQVSRERPTAAPENAKVLPTRAELRSELLAAFQAHDARIQKTWLGMTQSVSLSERRLAVSVFDLAARPPKTEMQLYDLERNRRIPLKPNRQMLGTAIAVSPDDRLLATAGISDQTIRLWELPTGRLHRRLTFPADSAKSQTGGPRISSVQSLRFSPDGKFLSAKSFGKRAQSIRLWDLKNPNSAPKLIRLSGEVPLGDVVFDQTGKHAISVTARREVTIWTLSPFDVAKRIKLPMDLQGHARMSPDGKVLALSVVDRKTSTSAIVLWDVDAGVERQRISTQLAAWATVPAFHPTGEWLATATVSGQVSIFDLANGREACRFDHGSLVHHLRFSRDGRHLYTGGMGSMKKWELALDSPTQSLSLDRPRNRRQMLGTFAFSPDGRRVAVQSSRTVGVYDRVSGRLERALKCDPPLFGLMFSPTGRRLLISGYKVPMVGSLRPEFVAASYGFTT